MSVNPISSNIVNLLSKEPVINKSSSGDGLAGNFSDIFTEAMKTVSETDMADKASAVELLTGQSDDMSGLLLDAQKAEIALNLALQLRSKAIDAYNEIMRMSV
ncbi:MAG: flagellar hook-basal body complex protein FliE [Oscillospiraceae bacterium]|jgi:flagellar hook-basal body complex protein FliE|nr:flagellar hook-basal body complex protein FliE [Oscillospiraceae bacterium]